MRFDANPRKLSWSHRNRGGSFTPQGRLTVHGDRRTLSNPRRWESRDTYSARVVVGFLPAGAEPGTKMSAAETERRMEQLVTVVRRVREQQVGDPGATFLAQRGLYRHAESGVVVDEPGAQVILFNTQGSTPAAFERQVEELAEEVARRLEQEEVIVEIQRNGISQKVFGVGT